MENDSLTRDRQYRLVNRALDHLAAHRQRQPSLAELAECCCLSEYHLQRLFSRMVGISPKRFLQFLNKEYLKNRLANSSLLDASLDAGLSSTSRLHDLFVTTESVTPAEYRSGGRGMEIAWGIHPSPFGEYLLGVTERGVCHLQFLTGTPAAALDVLEQEWPGAHLVEDDGRSGAVHERLFVDAAPSADQPLSLLLKGSNFQIKVWEALLSLPSGEVCCYGDIASGIGQPRATRAAASAIARNSIAWLIPCHRVIRKIGESGEYRWGRGRKEIMLAWEAGQREQQRQSTN